MLAPIALLQQPSRELIYRREPEPAAWMYAKPKRQRRRVLVHVLIVRLNKGHDCIPSGMTHQLRCSDTRCVCTLAAARRCCLQLCDSPFGRRA